MSHSFYSFREPFDSEQSGLSLVERHQRRNNIPHGPWSWYLHWFKHRFGWSRSQANNEDILFQIRPSRSIRPLLNYQIFAHIVITSLDYCNGLLGGKLCEVCHQSVIWWVRNAPCHTGWTFPQKLRSRLASSLLTHAFMDLLHPIWYLTPVSDIPGRTFAHLRSAAVDMLKYPGLGHRLWQSDPGSFVISSPSAWNFLKIELRDLGFSLRWKVYAFLFSSSAYSSVHQMLYIVFMFVNSRRLLFETICNSFLQ